MNLHLGRRFPVAHVLSDLGGYQRMGTSLLETMGDSQLYHGVNMVPIIQIQKQMHQISGFGRPETEPEMAEPSPTFQYFSTNESSRWKTIIYSNETDISPVPTSPDFISHKKSPWYSQ